MAHGLIKHPELPDLPPGGQGEHPHWDRDEVHDIFRSWCRLAAEYDGDRAFVAEAWTDTPERLAHYVRADGLHTAFNFEFLMASWDAKDLRKVIDDSLTLLSSVDALATWVLSNHDVMRHASRYARKTVKRWSPTEPYRPEGPVDPALGTRRAPGFTCIVNLSTAPYRLPDPTPALLTSGPVADGLLPPDHAVWLSV